MISIEKIDRVAFSEIGATRSHPYKEPGNKYAHGIRVSRICRTLCQKTGVEFTPVLDAAARLHDIRNGRHDHARLGAEAVRGLLAGSDICSAAELDEICAIITIHDDREAEGLSPEVMIHQDADLLDHFATFTVWSYFQIAARDGMSFSDTARMMLDEYERSYDRYLNQLHYDISRRIYAEKRAYKKSFAERMLAESEGRIIGINEDPAGE
ncbi:MAG: HD domain-containing protein [Clostridiales bacterium]|nr:HD domain-containing protein [Clostridiales bacterium]